ncbi:MAG: NHL domain-containing protein [Bacteroidia bacterium]
MKKIKMTVLSFLAIGTLSVFNAKGQIIYTVAGNGTSGYTGNGGLAQSAELHGPEGVTIDASGNLYIADNGNNVVRKVTKTGVISTYAGNGTAGFSGDGGQATAAELSGPAGVAIDANGNLYISDQDNQRIRKVTSTGVISTVAGNGTIGYYGNGVQATSAELNGPSNIAVDASGNLYIADTGNHGIRKVTVSTGIINTIAGILSVYGFSGDGGQATAAELHNPTGVFVDGSGNVYIADEMNQRIRKVNSAGIINTIAGTGTAGYSGDGGQATAAELYDPYDVELDASGNIYIADEQNFRIRKINTSGVISTYAGTGTAGFTGDGGLATAAEINVAYGLGIAIDGSGNLFIPDYADNRVREVSAKCPANAGPNVTNVEPCCGGWAASGVTIGTPSVTNMSYTWTPSNSSLSSYTVAQPTSTWSSTTCEIYSVSVSYSLCTTATSTVQVCAQAYTGASCCRLAKPTTDGFNGIALPTNFSVYPNPSNSSITIGLYDMADYVRIIDMQGRTVYEAQNTDAGELKLDISQYNKGIYFVMAKIGNTLEKQKLIVE